MKKLLAISNLAVILAVIAWNYLSNSLGIRGNTISSVSGSYENLFTPAGYAFSIWGVIFLGLIALGIFGVRRAFSEQGEDGFIAKIGPWLTLANLANAAWIWFWLTDRIGASVLFMALILVSLIVVIVRLNMERWDAPLPILAWVWWPICLYSGWIAVATIANVAAWLKQLGWEPAIGEVPWAVIMIVVAFLVNLLMVLTRNMREFAAVGIWALVAIAVRQAGGEPAVQGTALVAAIVLALVVSIHAYINRATNPVTKLLQENRSPGKT